MASSKQHDQIAERIARKMGGKYNAAKGPDIVTPQRVIEVGTDPRKAGEEIGQVVRYRKPRYVAGPPPFVPAAVKATKGTGVGVMDSKGRIVKRATRRRK